MVLRSLVVGILMGLSPWVNGETDFSAVAGAEVRIFTEEADQGQDDAGLSFYFEPEWFLDFDDSSLTIKPFLRWDSMDSERTHFDLREFNFQTVGDGWSLNIGINKVFWGVAETQHLVDIINQTDAIENIDGEDKLGQPMINFNFEESWGTLSLFALPGFRERTFPGEDGRLRLLFPINTDDALYESSEEDSRTDFAVRYSTYVSFWDIGVAHFRGTSRDPLFVLSPITFELTPYYPTITQTSLDAQATIDAWLLKLEMIYRTDFGFENDTNKDYVAAVTGFEYTSYGVFESAMDIGWILEYQYDERDTFGNALFSVEVSDLVLGGARLTFNDVDSTDLLLGIGAETDNDVQFFSIEGSRRIGNDMKLTIEGRVFTGIDENEPSSTLLYSYRNDDFIQLTFEKFF
ncbi:hypothetical protein [Pleionea sediminis]|uniref:hypothetical protein n=1 Tax=Pleionea sediminis TaxID=2569479 RepID=UPI0011861E99|nr:hypothetical protein [Pleionea sediminis]